MKSGLFYFICWVLFLKIKVSVYFIGRVVFCEIRLILLHLLGSVFENKVTVYFIGWVVFCEIRLILLHLLGSVFEN